MSAMLSHDLRKKYNVRSVPIRKNDEVKVMRGEKKGEAGKVVQVYRKKFVIHVERLTREKATGEFGIVPAMAWLCLRGTIS